MQEQKQEQSKLQEVIAELTALKIKGGIERDNPRFKILGFSYVEPKIIPQEQGTEGHRKSMKIVFSLRVTIDTQENKVSAWDYDCDGDQAEAERRKLHTQICKILNN